jgi:hypothetical protein
MKVPTSGSNREPRPLIPAGAQESRCFGVVDYGTHENEYEGEVKLQRKIKFFFELHEHPITYTKDEVEVTAPQVINVEFTLSASPKGKLKPAVEAWTGKSIDTIDIINDLIGLPASITVAHQTSKKGTTYAKIIAIAPLSEKLVKLMPEQFNPSMGFSIEENGFDSPEFSALYNWVQEDIKKSVEYREYLSGPKDKPFD